MRKFDIKIVIVSVVSLVFQYIQLCQAGTCTIGLYGSYVQGTTLAEQGPFILDPKSKITCSGDDLKGTTTILISNQLRGLIKKVTPVSLFKFTDKTCDATPCPLIQFNSKSTYGLNFKNSSIYQMAITPDANPPKSLLQASSVLGFQVTESLLESFAVNKCTYQSTSTYYNYKDGLGIRFPNKEQGIIVFDTPSNVTFVGSVFANNKAARGLIISSPGYVQLNSTVFTQNYGGLLINNGSKTAMSKVTFSKNKALTGGGMSINGATWSINGINIGFNDNQAENKTFPAGAGLYGVGGVKVVFQFATFSNNKNANFSNSTNTKLTSYVGQPGGGAMYLNGTSDVAAINCTFFHNQAFIGGALGLFGVSSFRVDITNFDSNVAELDAATIYDDQLSYFEIQGCRYQNSTPNISSAGSMILLGDPQGTTIAGNAGDIADLKTYTLMSANKAFQAANDGSPPDSSITGNTPFGTPTGGNAGNRCGVSGGEACNDLKNAGNSVTIEWRIVWALVIGLGFILGQVL